MIWFVAGMFVIAAAGLAWAYRNWPDDRYK
jgi:hypothetical protein